MSIVRWNTTGRCVATCAGACGSSRCCRFSMPLRMHVCMHAHTGFHLSHTHPCVVMHQRSNQLPAITCRAVWAASSAALLQLPRTPPEHAPGRHHHLSVVQRSTCKSESQLERVLVAVEQRVICCLRVRVDPIGIVQWRQPAAPVKENNTRLSVTTTPASASSKQWLAASRDAHMCVVLGVREWVLCAYAGTW